MHLDRSTKNVTRDVIERERIDLHGVPPCNLTTVPELAPNLMSLQRRRAVSARSRSVTREKIDPRCSVPQL
jgi:hypothetical protein